jgi:outer membrane protein
MRQLRIVASAFLVSVTAFRAEAQRDPLPSVPQSLSLEDAIELARRYSPVYRQALNDRGPAAWGVRSAFASTFLPGLSAGGGLAYTGSGSQTFLAEEFVQPSSTIGSSYSLGLSWQLSGETLSQPGLARAQLVATDATIEGALMELRAGVVAQYLATLQAVARVELAEVQLRRAEELLRLARARQEVGQTTILDVRRAEVARGTAEVALLQARQGVTVEKLRLFQQLGVAAPEDPTGVTLSDTFPVIEPRWTLGDLLALAQGNNPALRALRAQESAALWSERAAKSSWLPTLSFSAGWAGFTQQFTDATFLVTRARQDLESQRQQCEFINDNWLNPGRPRAPCDVIFAFTPEHEAQIRARNEVFPFHFTRQPFSARLAIQFPLFTQFRRPLSVSRASAAAEDARENLRARELGVRTEVSQGYYAVLTAYRTIEIRAANRAAAQEGLRLATERYRVGSGTFFELLDAQVTAQQAEADYITAVYDYHRALASLEAAVGRPLR